MLSGSATLREVFSFFADGGDEITYMTFVTNVVGEDKVRRRAAGRGRDAPAVAAEPLPLRPNRCRCG